MLVFRGLRITLFRHWNAFVDMMFVGLPVGTLSRKDVISEGEENQDVVSVFCKTTCIYVEDVMEICLVLISYHTGPYIYIYIIIYTWIYESSLSSTVCNSRRYSPKKICHDQKIQPFIRLMWISYWKMVIFQPAMWASPQWNHGEDEK